MGASGSWSFSTFVVMLVAALAVLPFAIAAIRRAARGTELARLPCAATHELRLDAPGPIVLHGEGPRFTRRFHGLAFRMLDRATGTPVPERRLWFHSHADGWSRVRLALVRFDVPRPGVYRLEVGGIVPAPASGEGRADVDARHAFVLMPPAGPGLPVAIVATIATAAVAIGSLVGIGLVTFGTDAGGRPANVGAGTGRAVDAHVAAHAGRQLRADPATLPVTQEIRWDGATLGLRVPAAWQVRAHGDELDVRDPARPSTYLVAHVVSFPPPTSAATLVGVALASAADRLASGLVEGYAAVRFADVNGVVTIESRGDGAGRMVVWNAYRPTAAGVRDVTLLVGAEAAELDRLEGTVVAILGSARFE